MVFWGDLKINGYDLSLSEILQSHAKMSLVKLTDLSWDFNPYIYHEITGNQLMFTIC